MVDGTQRFGTTYCPFLQGENVSCLHLQGADGGRRFLPNLGTYQVTWGNIPEDSNFRIYEFTLKT